MAGVYNINDPVWVKLTDEGLRISLAHNVRTPNHNGWVEYQLWVLMSVFGPKLFLGSRPYFVKNVIRFEKPGEGD